MALPTDRIKKIKLQNNTTYEIIPERLQNNGYQASLEELNHDSFLQIKQLKTYSWTTSGATPSDICFGQIIPNDFKQGWSVHFHFNIQGSAESTSTSSVIVYDGCDVILSNYGGYFGSSGASLPAASVHFIIIGEEGGRPADAGSGQRFIQNILFQPLVSAYCHEALQKDYGHLFGFRASSIPLSQATTFQISVKILETNNCSVDFMESSTAVLFTQTPGYVYNPNYYSSLSSYSFNNGLNSESIDEASKKVAVSSTSDTSYKHYLTFTGNSTPSIPSRLYRSSQLYYFNNTLYSTASGFSTGNVQYKNNYVISGGNAIYWPTNSGTVALTDDIQNVEIVDLTNVN